MSEGAIIPFARMFEHETWYGRLINVVLEAYDCNIQLPFEELSDMQNMLLYGDKKRMKCLVRIDLEKHHNSRTIYRFYSELERRYKNTDSEFIRQEIERYMRKDLPRMQWKTTQARKFKCDY